MITILHFFIHLFGEKLTPLEMALLYSSISIIAGVLLGVGFTLIAMATRMDKVVVSSDKRLNRFLGILIEDGDDNKNSKILYNPTNNFFHNLAITLLIFITFFKGKLSSNFVMWKSKKTIFLLVVFSLLFIFCFITIIELVAMVIIFS